MLRPLDGGTEQRTSSSSGFLRVRINAKVSSKVTNRPVKVLLAVPGVIVSNNWLRWCVPFNSYQSSQNINTYIYKGQLSPFKDTTSLPKENVK